LLLTQENGSELQQMLPFRPRRARDLPSPSPHPPSIVVVTVGSSKQAMLLLFLMPKAAAEHAPCSFNMKLAALCLLLLQLSMMLLAAERLPWDDLLLRCSSSPTSDGSCAAALQSFKECDALFGGSDDVLLRACRVAAWAESENHSLERVGTGIVTARWSSTPMGSFWFASATRADDTGLSATFEETLSMTPSMSTLLHERLRPLCMVHTPNTHALHYVTRSHHSNCRALFLWTSERTWAGWLRWRHIGAAA
jgi:hypothetical protein